MSERAVQPVRKGSQREHGGFGQRVLYDMAPVEPFSKASTGTSLKLAVANRGLLFR
jgi:hypothetical protein